MRKIAFLLIVILCTASCSGKTERNESSSSDAYTTQLEAEVAFLREQLAQTPADNGYSFYEEQTLYARCIVLEDNVSLCATPTDVTALLSEVPKGEVLDVYATVFIPQNERAKYWLLVRLEPYGAPSGNIGWLSAEYSVPYTQDVVEQATRPIKISEDCIDVRSGKLISELDGNFMNNKYRIVSRDESGHVHITSTGGGAYIIEAEYIVYPETNPAK